MTSLSTTFHSFDRLRPLAPASSQHFHARVCAHRPRPEERSCQVITWAEECNGSQSLCEVAGTAACLENHLSTIQMHIEVLRAHSGLFSAPHVTRGEIQGVKLHVMGRDDGSLLG